MNTLHPDDLNFFEPFAITYASAGYALRGYLLLPAGQEPFPAVIFQHGSAGLMPSNRPGIEALLQMPRHLASFNPLVSWQ